MKVAGARALVTGGASGIGQAVTSRLRGLGASVVVLDRTETGAETGIESGIVCDITDEPAVVDGVGAAVSRLGGLDVAVLCAGIGGMSPILKMSTDEWDRVMNVNLRGTFICLRECARAMSSGGAPGAIVAISSVSGFLADRSTSHYNVSKAGVDMLVRIAARELGPRRIRVNAVAPGTTATPLFAATSQLPGYQERVADRASLGRLGTGEDIAEAVVALVELDWVTGHTLVADGGLSLFSPIDLQG